MQVNVGVVQELKEELLAAVKVIAKRHGLNAEWSGRSYYNNESFGVKIQFSDENVNLKKSEFDMKCGRYGLSPKHYGMKFVLEGSPCVITGVNARARKYPVQYLKKGKPFKANEVMIKHALERQGLL